jgi:hypothetical protein
MLSCELNQQTKRTIWSCIHPGVGGPSSSPRRNNVPRSIDPAAEHRPLPRPRWPAISGCNRRPRPDTSHSGLVELLGRHRVARIGHSYRIAVRLTNGARIRRSVRQNVLLCSRFPDFGKADPGRLTEKRNPGVASGAPPNTAKDVTVQLSVSITRIDWWCGESRGYGSCRGGGDL